MALCSSPALFIRFSPNTLRSGGVRTLQLISQSCHTHTANGRSPRADQPQDLLLARPSRDTTASASASPACRPAVGRVAARVTPAPPGAGLRLRLRLRQRHGRRRRRPGRPPLRRRHAAAAATAAARSEAQQPVQATGLRQQQQQQQCQAGVPTEAGGVVGVLVLTQQQRQLGHDGRAAVRGEVRLPTVPADAQLVSRLGGERGAGWCRCRLG